MYGKQIFFAFVLLSSKPRITLNDVVQLENTTTVSYQAGVLPEIPSDDQVNTLRERKKTKVKVALCKKSFKLFAWRHRKAYIACARTTLPCSSFLGHIDMLSSLRLTRVCVSTAKQHR